MEAQRPPRRRDQFKAAQIDTASDGRSLTGNLLIWFEIHFRRKGSETPQANPRQHSPLAMQGPYNSVR
jgi:hypothetical protein